jgi:hypothetical protein
MMILILIAMSYLVYIWAYRIMLAERRQHHAVVFQNQPTARAPAHVAASRDLRPVAVSSTGSLAWTALDERQLTRLLEQSAR